MVTFCVPSVNVGCAAKVGELRGEVAVAEPLERVGRGVRGGVLRFDALPQSTLMTVETSEIATVRTTASILTRVTLPHAHGVVPSDRRV
jgi:hypothetical protein